MAAPGRPVAPARAPCLAVLLAHPAGHSLSPVMHDAAFRAAGLAGHYAAWDVAPNDLAAAVARLRADATILGANVTVPHKEAVRAHLDAATPIAARLGAVNTIRRRGGELVGDNTDAPGFARALAHAGLALGGETVLVLGAGGAARAVVAALVDAGAVVRLHNRTVARARDLAQAWRGRGAVSVVDDGELVAAARTAGAVVNTTSVGMQGGPPGSPLPAGALPSRGAVIDLVYRPRVTPLLAAAAAAGLEVQDGVAMLVHQGALSFEAWTGVSAPVAAMFAAVEGALGLELSGSAS